MSFLTFYSALAILNATNQYVPSGSDACKVQYARAHITWTNPSLNTSPSQPAGGVYNRVGITAQVVPNPTQPADQFVEVGWSKQINLPGIPNGHYIWVTYTRPNIQPPYHYYAYWIFRPQRNVHDFGIQYDPLVHHQWFVYENTQPLSDPENGYGITANFINGCAAVAGGEVVFGHEDMGNTVFYNLGWGTISASGIVSPHFWPANTPRLHQGRYRCTVFIGTPTAHYCGP
jgi:hypothetical protein